VQGAGRQRHTVKHSVCNEKRLLPFNSHRRQAAAIGKSTGFNSCHAVRNAIQIV
jgi:hypothetical protein